VIAPCDHSFGWEALVIHLGRGFFLSHDKMLMIEGVALNSLSAMPTPVTASLPSRCSPEEPKKPRPPVGASSLYNRQKKARPLGRASPVQAYDFPSRTRESECENASLASVAILRRLKGMLE
jgi:hypothetical protein